MAEAAEIFLQARCQAAAVRGAADAIVNMYRRGGKLLLCGNGGSAADAQHIAGEMTGRFLRERDPWPAIALHCNTSILTAIANDYSADLIFARQVEALGRPGDMLWAISTSGRSRNCIQALAAAKAKGVTTLALVGGDGGEMGRLADLCVHVMHSSTPRVQEAHIALAHIICELVELTLTDGAGGIEVG